MDDIQHYMEHCPNCGEYLSEESYTQRECIKCYCSTSPTQRRFAKQDNSTYFQKVTLINGEESTVVRRAEYLDMSAKILKVFGLFAVTEIGIECLDHSYLIEKNRLSDNWIAHMGEKTWVKMSDFEQALSYAKDINNQL